MLPDHNEMTSDVLPKGTFSNDGPPKIVGGGVPAEMSHRCGCRGKMCIHAPNS